MNDQKNASRDTPKEAKAPDFSARLASLSDSQLKRLADLIKSEMKDRDGERSILGEMSDKEFDALKDELVSKSAKEKSKKGAR